MRFLADENFPYPVALGLREAGYDVVHVAESNAALSDEEVLAAAATGGRILLTRDKGFGKLVFRKHLPTEGIVRIRLGTSDRRVMLDACSGWPINMASGCGDDIRC